MLIRQPTHFRTTAQHHGDNLLELRRLIDDTLSVQRDSDDIRPFERLHQTSRTGTAIVVVLDNRPTLRVHVTQLEEEATHGPRVVHRQLIDQRRLLQTQRQAPSCTRKYIYIDVLLQCH